MQELIQRMGLSLDRVDAAASDTGRQRLLLEVSLVVVRSVLSYAIFTLRAGAPSNNSHTALSAKLQ